MTITKNILSFSEDTDVSQTWRRNRSEIKHERKCMSILT